MEELYLGIETSCDDTSCAIYSPGRGVVVHRTAAQLDHEKYGGVVPEIASRSHMRTLLPLYETVMGEAGVSLPSLAGIGVTNGPGLTGSLLVGLSFAKALAYGSGVPLAGIHHIEGHILANALEGPLDLPALVLVVSGGHTQLVAMEKIGRYEIVGGTRDDAAGEAFDKIGKLLGLPFPGGPSIERAARGGNRAAYDFPRGLKHSGECDFSFSGLKTAVRLKVESLPIAHAGDRERRLRLRAGSDRRHPSREIAPRSERRRARTFYLAGGVAANGRLAQLMQERCAATGVDGRLAAARVLHRQRRDDRAARPSIISRRAAWTASGSTASPGAAS